MCFFILLIPCALIPILLFPGAFGLMLAILALRHSTKGLEAYSRGRKRHSYVYKGSSLFGWSHKHKSLG